MPVLSSLSQRPTWVIALLTGVLCATPAFGQAPPTVGLPGQAPPTKAGDIKGVGICGQCHNGYKEEGLLPSMKAAKSNEFILHNESVTWTTNDIHSLAYQNLSNNIGKNMTKVLGYDVAKAPQCLTCHAVDKSPVKPLADKKVPGDFITINGINCTACHGLGEVWQSKHTDPPENEGDLPPWREKKPIEKYNAGMADLRDPSVRALLCVSCHVGNAAEGKVVTHEMYAAGHPPLPPFELATFVDSEPKHWGYPFEKKMVAGAEKDALPYFVNFAKSKSNQETWDTFRFHKPTEESYRARSMVTGAIASLRAEALLLAADSDKQAFGLDYARFDCYACHHDLKYPSARQTRGYDAAPGRPTLKAWNGALPEVIAAHAAASGDAKLAAWGKAFPQAWKELRTAAHSKPFGDAPAVKQAASAVVKWSNDFLLLQSVTSKPIYTPAEAKKLLAMLGTAAQSPKWTADPEAAMTLTWAYVTLRNEIGPKLTVNQEKSVDDVLSIRVRQADDYTDGSKPKPIEAYLKKRLKKFADYKPDDLTKALKSLAP